MERTIKKLRDIAFRFLVIAAVLPLRVYSQDCALPEPFDHQIVFQTTIYVSPTGSDENGSGSETNPFASLSRAVRGVPPGTEIVLLPGIHASNQYIENLTGSQDAPIRITGVDYTTVKFDGGGQAIHLVDPKYVVLQNFTVTNMTGNGINIDDKGDYTTPAEYVIVRNIHVSRIGPTGNRDGIKLSGLDRFRVEHCVITQAGEGGSAIDMVGCHEGVIAHNHIYDCGSSGVQAKGGSSDILVYANRFENIGERAINAGGSTGMIFFRPLDAPYEAARITVIANIFTGSNAPVAFVGIENALVAHNTFYKPQRWCFRILQENLDAQLIRCRNNVVVNNIFVIDSQLSTYVNIGPNTHPDTFVIDNNLWFHTQNPRFRGPELPVSHPNSIIQLDPLMLDPERQQYQLSPQSPAIGKAGDIQSLRGDRDLFLPSVGDYSGACWNQPASLGAFEGNPLAVIQQWKKLDE